MMKPSSHLPMTNLMRELRRIKGDNARRLSVIDYDMKKKAGIAEKGPAPKKIRKSLKCRTESAATLSASQAELSISRKMLSMKKNAPNCNSAVFPSTCLCLNFM